MIAPPHPGEILKEEYLAPLNMSPNRLAACIGLTAARVNEIVRGKRGVTADTALRLARFFNTTAQFWLNLQSLYELRLAERKTGSRIERTVKPYAAA
jgi:addiction module HigA family antidote